MKVESESEVAQSCLTLCNPMDCSLPGSFIRGIFQARVLEWAFLLQGIFLTQGSNPCLLCCKQIPYCLSHQESPWLRLLIIELFSLGGKRMLGRTWLVLVAVHTHCERQFGNLAVLIS